MALRISRMEELRNEIIRAAIEWHETDGRNIDFAEATGELTTAVAEYIKWLRESLVGHNNHRGEKG